MQWLVKTTLLIALSTIVACGKKDSPSLPPDPKNDERISKHTPITGSLGTAVRELHKSEYLEECDTAVQQIQLELADALDQKQGEINTFLESQKVSASGLYERVTLGPTFARRAIKPFVAKKGWQEDEYRSWKELYSDYLNIRDTAVSTDWATLNSQVRSTIMDDQSRVNNGDNVYLDKDSGPMIATVLKEVNRCMNNALCIRLVFSDEDWKEIKKNPFYAAFYSVFHEAGDQSARKYYLEKFKKRLEYDYSGYRFYPNEDISKSDEKTIQLPLDAGAFAGHEKDLQKYIEEVWTSNNLSLKIVWESVQKIPSIYKIILGEGVGGRAYVRRRDKTVNLFPDGRVKTIAHEIGHVIGFPDHYYTVWKPESCTYLSQYNEEDLMSSSETGTVTTEEWDTLQKEYAN